jgi:hypothetical protein
VPPSLIARATEVIEQLTIWVYFDVRSPSAPKDVRFREVKRPSC